MIARQRQSGFSLVEILISLFVVSITAVCIIHLQKEVSDQSRDTYIYGAVLNLSMSEIDDKVQGHTLKDIDALDGVTKKRTLEQTNTELTLDWFIQAIDNNQTLRQVTLKISWLDAAEKEQSFSYQLKIKGAQDAKPSNVSAEATIVESFLEGNNYRYFNPKIKYEAGDFVIYNSQLFKADSDHDTGYLPEQDAGWVSKGADR